MNLGIVGAGSIGQRHARNARTLGATVTLYDTQPRDGAISADRFDATAHEAIVIATPYESHLAYATQAADAGCPFLVEKPLGGLDQIDAWTDFASREDLPYAQVGYQCRYHPEAVAIALMDPSLVSVTCHVDMRTWPGTYGDPLLECSHDLDLALWWTRHAGIVGFTRLSAISGTSSTLRAVAGADMFDLRIVMDWQSTTMLRRWYGLDDARRCIREVTFTDESTIGDAVYVDEMDDFLANVRYSHGSRSARLVDGVNVLRFVESLYDARDRASAAQVNAVAAQDSPIH